MMNMPPGGAPPNEGFVAPSTSTTSTDMMSEEENLGEGQWQTSPSGIRYQINAEGLVVLSPEDSQKFLSVIKGV